jgi:hypothetical protein
MASQDEGPSAASVDDQFLRDARLLLALKRAALIKHSTDAGPDESAEPARDRVAAMQALAGVIDYLSVDCKFAAWLGPLEQLAAALMQVEEGHKHPLLMPEAQGNRQRDHMFQTTVKGRAAAAMELWIDAGQSKMGAATEVADALKEAECRLKGRADKFIKAETVASWRNAVIGRAPPSPARNVYRKTLNLAKNAKMAEGLSDEEVAKRATSALQSFVQKHDLREI